ncbi:hypothetical protein [Actinophytocola sp.]|uniref:hypothetical protein n=1 Tax=Actinophytocola sp. TaxID=1872138 RepID=UPI002D53D402|nr:hypothetical protein [Actinophytocola sp.]HYQ69070.1 hypothetical protein [Actinophytocola sp.]
MSDLADLITAIAALLGALTSAGVLVWAILRSDRKPERAAKAAADNAAAAIVEALADGQITPDEVNTIRGTLQPPAPDENGGTP